MLYTQNITSCFKDKIGASGLDQSQFDKLYNQCRGINNDLMAENLPLFQSPYFTEELKPIRTIASHIQQNFKNLIVLGTGGSTLNPQTLIALNPYSKTRVVFLDSVDPFTIDNRLSNIDLSESAFLSISKSGSTVETLAQSFAVAHKLKTANIKNIGKQFYIITMHGKNPLREFGENIDATILEHHPDIGGRFSTFTNVGFLAAMVADIDIDKIQKGARNVLDNLSGKDDPVQGAALQCAFMQNKMSATILMPYIDRLAHFATWFRQIWSESLGKEGKGNTPIRAMGTLDQHSQLQLYLDGPKDKFFSLIGLNCEHKGEKLELGFLNNESINYLQGRTIGDVNKASYLATTRTLENNGCPLRTFDLEKFDEEDLGALLMHFILETVITAKYLGLNPFDQPAVEQGKILSRQILASKNLEIEKVA